MTLAGRIATLEADVGGPGSPNGSGPSGLHGEIADLREDVAALRREAASSAARLATLEARIGAPDSADDGGPTGLYSALEKSTAGISAPDPKVRREAWIRTVLLLAAMVLTAILARR